ncbi:helix-turn-helix transcriptional regulator [Streptosporangium sandarakinum]|uniref:helix-turn-helix transcriptional regulator n=1 Tax=Streptosporangium sandarakinum TaxID=1260955 RepID=UPI0034211274
MPQFTHRPVANGLRTDHPIPDLPFVDDALLPLDDPAAIEAIGRGTSDDMWGREDPCEEGWFAFTTDPRRTDLAWAVRYHPEHGHCVVLYRDDEVASVHQVHLHEAPRALLFRAGGYWWDGATWFRPGQVYDFAEEKYYERPAPGAASITAADLLRHGGDATQGDILQIEDMASADEDTPPIGNWIDHLALWAQTRSGQSLHTAVVNVMAPELNSDQLIGPAQVAELAGIASSTLRSYIARGEGDLPLPQAKVGGRNLWARVVAQEWVEQRNRSDDGVEAVMAGDHDGHSLAPGIAEAWTAFSRTFFSLLWERQTFRKRWSLRWRTQAAVREVAETLSWDVAASIPKLAGIYDLAVTVQHAVLHDYATGRANQNAIRGKQDVVNADHTYYGITPHIARTLTWLIRHDPAVAARTIEQITGEALRMGIPRQVSERSIATALSLNGTFDPAVLKDFLSRVFTPTTTA